MPEIKRAFNVGKMSRDLDERIVPAGEYREGLNINIGQYMNHVVVGFWVLIFFDIDFFLSF